MRSNFLAIRFFIAFSLLALTLAACGPAKTPAAGEAVQFSNACDKANNGKDVAVEGYLRFPEILHRQHGCDPAPV